MSFKGESLCALLLRRNIIVCKTHIRKITDKTDKLSLGSVKRKRRKLFCLHPQGDGVEAQVRGEIKKKRNRKKNLLLLVS